ncbi:MAG: hypothetical protein KF724_09070 [Phycisphaeraceae bacterium]|nr:hypothetical protein [Phycisphaeraceae bacterium]
MMPHLPRRNFLAASGLPLAALLASLPREVLAALPQAQDVPPPPTPPAPRALPNPGTQPTNPRQRVISYFLIGGSCSTIATRRISTVTREDGWAGFIQRWAKPAFEWGSRRFWLQWPFGTSGTVNNTDWDQFMDAKDAGLDWLTKDFVDRWRPIREGSLGVPVDITAYIGSALDDPTMMPLLLKERYAEWLVRAVSSVVPYLMCRMNIGVDASVRVPQDQPDLHLCSLLSSLGTKIFVETRPQVSHPYWNQFNVVVDADFWYTSDPKQNPGATWAIPNDQLKGEIVRGIMFPPKGKNWDDIGWMVQEARKILREGHTVLLNTNHLQAKGVSMDDLVAGI